MPCDWAQRSFTPRHSGKPATSRCAEEPMNSMFPSRIAPSAFSTGTIISNVTSSPSLLKNPSSTAAMAGKYEFEIRSGIASFIANA